jgi:hypothetical protein
LAAGALLGVDVELAAEAVGELNWFVGVSFGGWFLKHLPEHFRDNCAYLSVRQLVGFLEF